MKTSKRLICLAMLAVGALALLVAIAGWSRASADQAAQLVGCWFGNVNLPAGTFPGFPGGGFPFMAKFNADGTWTGDDARKFGLLPGFPQQTTVFLGSWTRAGGHTYTFRALQVDQGPFPPPPAAAIAEYEIVRVEGTVEVRPGDPNHLIGTTGVQIFPCPPDNSGFGFTCPDPLSVPFEPAVTFSYTLDRILPPER